MKQTQANNIVIYLVDFHRVANFQERGQVIIWVLMW